MADTGMRAAMLMKELCSYPWVNQTYGKNLPNVPWTAARQLPGDQLAARPTGTAL
jgi:hypothetical protein